MDKVAGRVVWLLGWVIVPIVWLMVAGLVLVVCGGGVMEGGREPGAALGPPVASVTGAAVCEVLGVASVCIMGLVDAVLLVVIGEVVVRVLIVVCVGEASELEVVAAT